jgi:hypothetical protein
MTLGVSILLITAISLRIHNWKKDRKIPSWIKVLTILSWKLQCRPVANSVKLDGKHEGQDNVASFEVEMNGKDENEVKPADQNDGGNVLWTDVTSAIDFYMFFISLLIIFIATAFCIGLASRKDDYSYDV